MWNVILYNIILDNYQICFLVFCFAKIVLIVGKTTINVVYDNVMSCFIHPWMLMADVIAKDVMPVMPL